LIISGKCGQINPAVAKFFSQVTGFGQIWWILALSSAHDDILETTVMKIVFDCHYLSDLMVWCVTV